MQVEWLFNAIFKRFYQQQKFHINCDDDILLFKIYCLATIDLTILPKTTTAINTRQNTFYNNVEKYSPVPGKNLTRRPSYKQTSLALCVKLDVWRECEKCQMHEC